MAPTTSGVVNSPGPGGRQVCGNISKKQGMCVINDPLGQAHRLASCNQCFHLFCFARFRKWGRADERTDIT